MSIETLPIQSDPFLLLLTDALRDGPGSPAWQRAIGALAEQNLADASSSGGADSRTQQEYQLLVRVREHLESGREFRSIRPGPALTRKVFSAIDAEPLANRSWSIRQVLWAVSLLCVVVSVAVIGWWLAPRTAAQDPDVAALQNLLLTTPVAALNVDRRPPSSEWRAIGSVPLRFDHGVGLRSAVSKSVKTTEHDAGKAKGDVSRAASGPVGGGLMLTTALPADDAFVIDAEFQADDASSDLIPEIAVSDSDDFTGPVGASAHELVWAMQGHQAKVILPNGRLAAQTTIFPDRRHLISVRIRVSQRAAIVDLNGRPLWSGASGLSENKPRFVAVRIIRSGDHGHGGVMLQSLRLLSAR